MRNPDRRPRTKASEKPLSTLKKDLSGTESRIANRDLRNLLRHSQTPRTPDLSKICPSYCFGGFQSGGQKFEKNCQNLSENYGCSNFDNFFQILDPRTGTPKNHRWDKFWTNLGFGAFWNAVRGRRFRESRFAIRPTLDSESPIH